MTGRSSLRPRRTRVYESNYNAGENYYKSALDNLDKKYSAPSVLDRISASRKPDISFGMDDDLSSARLRAGKVISENGIFDHGNSKSKLRQLDFDDELDEQIQTSLNRIRANKKAVSISDDFDMDDSLSTIKRKAKNDFADRIESMDDDFGVSSFRKSSALKSISARADKIIDSSSLSSWNQTDEIKSAASNRAKATKARLNDLESEMFERSEKQAARDKRSANLKKFLADNEFDSEQTSHALRVSAQKTEKKVVSF